MPDELTYYGYEQPGSPDWDHNSWMGIGDRQNDLVAGYSVALSKTARQQILGSDSPTSTGREFQYQGKTYRDDDTSPQNFANVDVFSPGGIPGSANYTPNATPLGKMSGQSLNSNTIQSSSSSTTATPDSLSQAVQDATTPLSLKSPTPPTTQSSGQSPAQQFASKYPQFNNVDLSTIMQKVQALHPNIEPTKLDELWNKSNSWQELSQASKSANNQYGKSFDLLKQLYETNVTGVTDGGSESSSQ